MFETEPDVLPSQEFSEQVDPIPQELPPSSSKVKYLAIALVFLLGLSLVGVASYFLGRQSAEVAEQPSEPTPTPAAKEAAPTSTPQLINGLPEGWSYKENGKCNVKFAIPPKQEPYYYPVNVNRPPSVTNEEGSGRFWDFPRGAVYPNLLSKLPNWDDSKYDLQAATMFASPEEASGYVSQAVVVSCMENNGLFTDNNQLLSVLAKGLDDYNNNTSEYERGMQASDYNIKSTNPTQKWGKNIAEVAIAEDQSESIYAMFVTPEYVYEVRVLGYTQDNFVKQTAQEIYNNLVFE